MFTLKKINPDILLKDLNPEQREAVLQVDGPVLVIAGAGSGKTRVLTYRIAYLIGVIGVNPYEIYAATFTNKAAQEMKDRIENLIGMDISQMWIGTFHSLCARILRRHAGLLGYSSNFTIYDRTDQKNLVKTFLENNTRIKPQKLVSRISAYKNGSYIPEDPEELNLMKKYEQIMKENNALDFDDLLLLTIRLFEENPRVKNYYAEKFKYVHVDEYQDTNRTQYRLLLHLSSVHRNIFAVGDEDQSIYGFRGADIRNILDFEKDFPEAKIIRLEQNYRSTKNILKAATKVIANNRYRRGKTLWTENPEGEKIKLIFTRDEIEEAEKVVQYIFNSGRPYKDFVILYRTNAQSRSFEQVLRNYNIPYTIVGGIKFYERKEIKDILAYLKILVNPRDEVSLLRIINVPPRGIGKKTIEFLRDFGHRNNFNLFETLQFAENFGGIRANTKLRMMEFYENINFMREYAREHNVYEVTKKMLSIMEYRSYIISTFGENSIEAESKLENIDALLGSIARFVEDVDEPSVENYITSISLLTDIDEWDNKDNIVTLMTVHNAKGLEFPVVFITGLEETVFPHISSFGNDYELEEERRLFHVALTRAKEKVILTFASRRSIRPNSILSVSRFIKEVPEDIIEQDGVSISFTQENVSTVRYKVGDNVYHNLFGFGRVLKVSDGKVEIRFKVGIKKIREDSNKLRKV